MKKITIEYWRGEKWWVGKIRECPGVVSQGKTISSLMHNIADAYRLMMKDKS